MARSSASFDGDMRVHVALGVKNLEESVRFYSSLFGQPSSKERASYAKFEPRQPSLNLALNEHPRATPARLPAHFGIQVKSTDDVAATTDRFRAAGLATRVEENTTCCHAVQDKVWVSDPDGNAWEVFTVLADAEEYVTEEYATDTEEACCSSDCCST